MKPPSSRWLSLFFLTVLLCFWLSMIGAKPVPQVQGNQPIASYPQSHLPLAAWLRDWTQWLIQRNAFRYALLVQRSALLESLARKSYPLPVSPGHAGLTMGKEGWVFLQDDGLGHQSDRFIQEMGEHAAALSQLVRESGRSFCLIPLPDKSSVYADYTGWQFRMVDRGSQRQRYDEVLRSALQATPQSYCPLWRSYADARNTAPQRLLYWPADSHWNSHGMTLALREVLEKIQPGLWQDAAVKAVGQRPLQADLRNIFLLQPQLSYEAAEHIQRTGPPPHKVSECSVPGYPLEPIVRYQQKGLPVLPGRTLVIADSFVLGAVPHWVPWFEDVTFIHFSYTGSAAMAEELRQCDRLLFTSVERLLRWRLKAWATKHQEEIATALARD